MSLVIQTHIICDRCGTTFGVDFNQLTGYNQRKAAKLNGWIYSGNKDYCPDCIPSKNPRINPKELVRLKYNKLLSRLISNGNEITNEEFVIEWPCHKLHGQKILRRGCIKLISSKKQKRTRYLYYFKNNKPFKTIQSFIDHFKNA